mmetsp:Transcript_68821/g.109191  ORF Transcript_68821/g.109191 Transcript_68821/m.109191 type:complete len:235 (+) Transcript_68821:93-797(+)
MMRATTPPRKQTRNVPSDSSSPKMAAPQVVFSPGKRLRPDGATHDAAMEVKAFLRRKGVANADIPCIMNGTPSVPSSSSSIQAPRAHSAASSSAPKRLKLADHARAVNGSSSGAKKSENTFSADLLDVLDGAMEVSPSYSSEIVPQLPLISGYQNGLSTPQSIIPAPSPATATSAEEDEGDSWFDDIDDDDLLAAVREVEQRLARERDARLIQTDATLSVSGHASCTDSLPLFR